jgi:methyltransferase
MTLFIIIVSVVIVQRLAELLLARRNASKMSSLGAVEHDKKGYKYIVIMHISFFIAMVLEFIFLNRSINVFSPYLFVIFLLAQVLRYWAITTLGVYWNTRIIVLKGSKPIYSGPYKFLKHPNYIAVITELAVIPLMFSCYFTSLLFTPLNLSVLRRRIKIETAALLNNQKI